MKLHKIFLLLALSSFLFSLTKFGGAIGWGIIRPLSSVAFILFFILNMLKTEGAKFDEEQAELTARAKGEPPANPVRATKTEQPEFLQQNLRESATRAH
jgi:hypothetical protein